MEAPRSTASGSTTISRAALSVLRAKPDKLRSKVRRYVELAHQRYLLDGGSLPPPSSAASAAGAKDAKRAYDARDAMAVEEAYQPALTQPTDESAPWWPVTLPGHPLADTVAHGQWEVFGGANAPWRSRKVEHRHDADAGDDPDVGRAKGKQRELPDPHKIHRVIGD